MTYDDAAWLTSQKPLRVDVLGLTLTTRIPDFDGRSAAAILHPFEGANGQPLKWLDVLPREVVNAVGW